VDKKKEVHFLEMDALVSLQTQFTAMDINSVNSVQHSESAMDELLECMVGPEVGFNIKEI
jgi:hypothetical protein